MIRGLFIRQVFVMVDLALAVAIMATLSVVGWKFLEAPADSSRFTPDGAPSAASVSPVLQVAERGRYDAIIQQKLFGVSGSFDAAAAAAKVEAPPPVTTVETSLNLQLVGATASTPKDPAASAIIVNLDDQAASGTFLVGQPVIHDETRGDVILVEVYPTEVMLLNKQKNPETRERLAMADVKNAGEAGAALASGAGADNKGEGGNRITINREEFVQDLYTNYAELVTSIRPEYYRDAQGNVVGLTAQNISQVPMAQKLGLQDGDVLQSINNETIDSEQKVMELFQRYRDSSAFRIGIMRNGKPQVITYRLE